MPTQRSSALLAASLLCGVVLSAQAQTGDPPGRVGRISDLSGTVSLMPNGATDWSSASINYPVSSGDAVFADAGARAEIHVGSSAVRVGSQTSLAFDAIEDYLTQLRMGPGSVQIRVRALDPQESYEIDTPSGVVLLRSEGSYRIDVTPDGNRSTVTARGGNADVMVGTSTYHVGPGASATFMSGGSSPFAIGPVVPMDTWENWADSRDRREDALTSTRYVSRDMVGYEDLDQYGNWQVDATYGPVWQPRTVSADWAPYRVGHWENIGPWGWTWIDDAPWGFAPFHYGRWASLRGRWSWMPGTVRARPVYAPALVAFVSGAGWGASMSFGTGGGVGWVALGPDEPFIPAYQASPVYRRNVNITSVHITTIDVTRVDVTQIRYVNRSVPGGVTAVPRDAFIRSRPIASAAVTIRPNDLAAARIYAAPNAAGAPIVVTRPAQARSQNVGAGKQPAVAIQRAPTPPVPWRGAATQRGGAGQAAGRAVAPPTAAVPPTPPGRAAAPPPTPPVQGRGGAAQRGGGGQAGGRAVTPPTTAVPPTPPGRAGVTPPPTPPTPPVQGRGAQRGGGGQAGGRAVTPPTTAVPPTPPGRAAVTPPPTPPTPPPAQGRGAQRGGGGQAGGRAVTPPTTAVPPTPPGRATVQRTPPDTARPPQRGRGGQAAGRAVTPPTTAAPPMPPGRAAVPPPTPPVQGRGAAAQRGGGGQAAGRAVTPPTTAAPPTPPGRAAVPPPDTARPPQRGGGGGGGQATGSTGRAATPPARPPAGRGRAAVPPDSAALARAAAARAAAGGGGGE